MGGKSYAPIDDNPLLPLTKVYISISKFIIPFSVPNRIFINIFQLLVGVRSFYHKRESLLSQRVLCSPVGVDFSVPYSWLMFNNFLHLWFSTIFFLQGLGEFVTFFQKLQTVCEETADAK